MAVRSLLMPYEALYLGCGVRHSDCHMPGTGCAQVRHRLDRAALCNSSSRYEGTQSASIAMPPLLHNLVETGSAGRHFTYQAVE